MTGREIINLARAELKDVDDGYSHAEYLFEDVFRKRFHDFSDKQLPPDEEYRYLELVARRKSGEPVQYLLGLWPFLDAEYSVGPGVLIPRPETEELAALAIEVSRDYRAPRVLDLCSGTGCIGISISMAVEDSEVICVEKYGEAYSYLKANATRLSPKVKCLMADIADCDFIAADRSVDLIVSNPPYVSEVEYGELEDELYFEPRTALVAMDDGLEFFKLISLLYRCKLRPGGAVIFEIGSAQSDAVIGILNCAGFLKITSINDLSGLPRIVMASI